MCRFLAIVILCSIFLSNTNGFDCRVHNSWDRIEGTTPFPIGGVVKETSGKAVVLAEEEIQKTMRRRLFHWDSSTHETIEKSAGKPFASRDFSLAATVAYTTGTTASTKYGDQGDRTTTPFAALWSSIASSFSLTLFTEFGDRTFFIAAILSLRFPRCIVFVATCLALVIQTVFSTCVGQILHSLPEKATASPLFSLPIDDYAAAILLFVFGCLHLRAACYHDEEDINDLKVNERFSTSENKPVSEFESHADNIPYVELNSHSKRRPNSHSDEIETESGGAVSEELSLETITTPHCPAPSPSGLLTSAGSSLEASRTPLLLPRDRPNRELLEAEMAVENMETSQSSLASFRHIFWIIFVAELGDKSMISTVALATAQNPYGVFVGSSLAHCFVTLIAVVAGGLLEGYISERIANGIGAALFLTFAVLTTLEGLARQGVQMWWFIGEKASALFLAYFFTTGELGTSTSFAHSTLRMLGAW